MGARTSKRWTLRALSSMGLTIFGAIALAVTVALGLSAARLQDSTVAIGRDMRSMALADEIALELLSHNRLSYMVLDTADPRLERALADSERAMAGLVSTAGPLSATSEETELLERIEDELEVYLAARARAVDVAASPREAVRSTQPALDTLLASVETLRELNEVEVAQRHLEAQRIDRLATTAAVVIGAVLLLGLGAASLATRWWLLRPLRELRGAIERYRSGEGEVPIRGEGPREIAGIADAFEDMRVAFAQQRGDRLAFLAGVAHDLRNPLSPLKQGVALLAREASLAESETAKRTLAILDRQIDRLNRMVTDLLDSARIEAGELELALADVDLREPVRELVTLHAVASTSHRLELELPEEPVRVRVDPLRIEQVVGNLLSNAIKYSPEGGPVEVSVREDAGAGEARITVRDRGIGIAPEELPGLFDPFRRREGARAVAPGAGLGLSVVQRIVDAHGGRVTVESERGVGSTFEVCLPLAR